MAGVDDWTATCQPESLVWDAAVAPISANVQVTFALPLTLLLVFPIFIALLVPQFAVVMLALPLKDVPLMVRAVAKTVAFAAVPDVDNLPFSCVCTLLVTPSR